MSALAVSYCAGVVLASLLGGLFPLTRKISHARLQLYLALSGGVMLGASLLHMIPESADILGHNFGIYVILGVLGLYFVQRFLAPHSHEMEEAVMPHATAHEIQDPKPATTPSHHHHPEAVSAWAVIAGLSIHSLFAGVALGGALQTDGPATRALALTVFLVIALHKPADSLTVTAMLLRKGTPRATIAVCQLLFSLLVPLGLVAFVLARGAIPEDLGRPLTGAVLAVTAGMFICISLGDLLPEVQFHAHDRFKLSAALLAGVLLMALLRALEPERDHPSPEETQTPISIPFILPDDQP